MGEVLSNKIHFTKLSLEYISINVNVKRDFKKQLKKKKKNQKKQLKINVYFIPRVPYFSINYCK